MRRRPIDLRQRSPAGARCARRARARRGQRVAAPGARCPRPAAPAAASAGRPAAPCSAAVERRLRRRAQGLAASGAEVQPPAARADGRQQPARLRRDQQEQAARGRLLQRLQQRVGGIDVELVGRSRRSPRARRPPPRSAPGTTSAAAPRRRGCSPRSAWRAVVGPAQHQQARMRQRADLARGARLGRDLEALPRGIALVRLAPARAAPADRPASPCRCPPAPRAARRGACARRRRPAPAPARPPRGRTGSRVSRGCGKPSSRSASGSASVSCGAGARAIRARPASSALDVRPDLGRDRRRAAGAVDHDAALRLGLGDGEVAGAQALVELRVAALEADRHRPAPTSGAAPRRAPAPRPSAGVRSRIKVSSGDGRRSPPAAPSPPSTSAATARRRRPGRRGWNPRSGRRSPSRPPPASAGWSCRRWSARAA